MSTTQSAASTKRVPHKSNGKHRASDEPARPYRLWNANEKRAERWRCYSSIDNAHNGATLQLRWSPLGTHIEVYDCRTWRHLGTYSKKLKSGTDGATFSIDFTKGDGHVIVRANERQ